MSCAHESAGGILCMYVGKTLCQASTSKTSSNDLDFAINPFGLSFGSNSGL